MKQITLKSEISTINRLKELINNLLYLDSAEPKTCVHVDKIDFVTPFSITPIASMLNKKELSHDYEGDKKSYLETIYFPDGLDRLEAIPLQKTFLPIIHLNIEGLDKTTLSERMGLLLTKYMDLVRTKVVADQRFIELITNNTFGFLLGEMLDNIEEHSEARNIYLCAQYWSKINSCEVCILDDGKGLYQSLKDAGRDVKDSQDAIKKILETGLSAKNEFGDIKRGTGIRHTRAAITSRELNGEYLIISGNGAYLHSAKEGEQFIKFSKYYWNGVIIMMKFNKPEVRFNLYDYVK